MLRARTIGRKLVQGLLDCNIRHKYFENMIHGWLKMQISNTVCKYGHVTLDTTPYILDERFNLRCI